ncbi:MAG: AmmeMemoRadiSam system protein B [Deltaproteobacteria bacterium]|nr:AmmeMemoRadiSam system protein B [Deltaproteobacteria bacterium]
MKEVFNPVVSGSFYPGTAQEIRSMLDKFDKQVKRTIENKGEVLGLISPHAGYIYSGRTAAYGFKLVEGKKYDLIVVMAPSHRMRGNKAVILDYDAYKTPLGELLIDREVAGNLLKDSKNFISEANYFRVEHSLEVQLPFIQYYLKDPKILPIIVPVYDKKALRDIATSIFNSLKNKNVLYIASSDMAHYKPYEENNAIDEYSFSILKKNDPDLLFEEEMQEKTQFCGIAPIIVLMNIAKLHYADGPYVVFHENSGDTAGDKSAVVGYGSVAYFKATKSKAKELRDDEAGGIKVDHGKKDEKTKYSLTDEEKRELLRLARNSITYYLENKKEMEYTPKSERLKEKGAAFVTLKKHGTLRGCIGHIMAFEPLYKSVLSNAVNAAVSDPRFHPLSINELKDIEIEISVLTPLEPIRKEDIVLGRDGLVLTKGFNKGVFLPQVPEEAGWKTVDEYLSHLCLKAGLDRDCYKKGDVRLEKFEAIVFHESDFKDK